jgi:hypothetical protein
MRHTKMRHTKMRHTKKCVAGVPRTEATSIVGALLPFPTVVTEVPLLLPSPNELSLVSSVDLKDQIIGVLLKSGKKEPAGAPRFLVLGRFYEAVSAVIYKQNLEPI